MTSEWLCRLGFGTSFLLVTAVTACAAPASVTPVTFHEGVAAGTGATAITLSADACQRQPYGLRISESAKQVRVALSASPSAGRAAPSCSDLVVVRLNWPIGDRTLVDANTERQVPLRHKGAGRS